MKEGLVDLSVVIVSYNTAKLLRACLQSVYANLHPQYSVEVIVVDNASTDDSAEMVRRDFPQVHLIANSENRGFAAANNQALKVAKGNFIVLLNPDTEVVGDALWQMLAFLEAEPHAAMVGPALLYPDGTFQDGAFHFPGLSQIFLDFFPLNWRLLRSRLNGRYPRHLYEGTYPAAFEIDFPLGACLMLPRIMLEHLGLLDESFFMYMEEIDWCYRIKTLEMPPGYLPPIVQFRPGRRKSHHWQVYCLPTAKITHHAGASSRQFRDEMFYQLYRSRAYFYKKHYSHRFQSAARLLTRLGLVGLTISLFFNRLLGQVKPEEFQARRRAYQRVWNL
jgi:GT2 family glycosyltransferase